MYIVYLSILLIVVFGVVSVILACKNNRIFAVSISLFILSVFFFIIVENMRPDERYVKEKINYYNNLKEQVEIVKNLQNKEFRDIFEDDLTREMNKMNREIRLNKNYNSEWTGCLCSEEIGKLEVLSW